MTDETRSAVSTGTVHRRIFLNDLSTMRRAPRLPPAFLSAARIEIAFRFVAVVRLMKKNGLAFPALFFNTRMDGYQIEIE
ncbi:hypothetical protein [Burkholderia sp. YIM B11467]